MGFRDNSVLEQSDSDTVKCRLYLFATVQNVYTFKLRTRLFTLLIVRDKDSQVSRCIAGTLLGILFCTLFFSNPLFAQSKLFNSKTLKELNDKLEKESFFGVKGARYESSIWSGVAAVETRAYPWSNSWWRKIDLKWPKERAENPYYRGTVPAYYYEGSGEELLLIFGTSFGTVGRGTWYRKFLKIIRESHPHSSVLIFPGYLSKENLSDAKPYFADSGVRFVSRDILIRIENFLSQKALAGKHYRKVGSVGLSGGASLVLRMLHINQSLSREAGWYPCLLNWGNLALSPVLSASAAADVLDAQADFLEQQKRVNSHFDIEDWLVRKVLGGLLPWNKKLTTEYMLEITQEPERPVYQQLQGLVAYSVIHELAQFTKTQTPEYRGRLRYKDYYEDFAHSRLKQLLGDSFTMGFEQYSSFSDSARATRGSLRLVFAEDDPILSVRGVMAPEERGHPRVLKVLREYQANPSVRVDMLRFGGHLAYLVDNEYVGSLFRQTFR